MYSPLLRNFLNSISQKEESRLHFRWELSHLSIDRGKLAQECLPFLFRSTWLDSTRLGVVWWKAAAGHAPLTQFALASILSLRFFASSIVGFSHNDSLRVQSSISIVCDKKWRINKYELIQLQNCGHAACSCARNENRRISFSLLIFAFRSLNECHTQLFTWNNFCCT